MSDVGFVAWVESGELGSQTSVAALTGDTEIVVTDVSDFLDLDETAGGLLDIGQAGDPLAFTAAVLNDDLTTGTITLAAALLADVDEGVRVDLWVTTGPVIGSKAGVIYAGIAEPVDAVIPHALVSHLPEGPRADGEAEQVSLAIVNDELTITDILQKKPSINAGYLTPGSLSLSTSHDPTENMSTVTFLGATLAQPNGTVVLNATANTGQIFDMITAAAAGYDPRQSCRFATTGSETFTIVSGSVTQIAGTTLDSGSPGISDRILVKNAPAASGAGVGEDAHPANGIYRVTNATTNLTLTRTTDMSGFHDPQGDYVFVQAGGQAACGFVVIVPSSTGSFTYGTDNIRWTQCSGSSSGSGSVDGGTP